jgi:KDO2-lipid IV(A) lauroyltransferase
MHINDFFPHLSEEDRNKTVRNYYKNCCDLIVEVIKFFTISEDTALKLIVYKNGEILKKFYDQGRNAILMLSHFNNWEACVTSPKFTNYKIKSLYKRQRNHYFTNKILTSRKKFGMDFITPKLVSSKIKIKESPPSLFCFFSDQSPSSKENSYKINFLNKTRYFVKGPEIYAKTYNYPVFYASINRLKRGKYEMVLELIHDEPSKTADGFVTQEYAKRLERDILNSPHSWFWIFRKWKHTN